jgi:hypothetical protein
MWTHHTCEDKEAAIQLKSPATVETKNEKEKLILLHIELLHLLLRHPLPV